MRNHPVLTATALVAVSCFLVACAGSPTAPAHRSPPQSLVPEDSGEPLDPALAEAARGYTKVKRGNELMFCKRERQTGSNLSSTTCLTEAQLRQRAEDSKKVAEDMRRQGRRCAGAGCQPGG